MSPTETGTLTSEQRATLEQTLAAFEARKGSQLAVLIVASTAPEEIEQFALRVAEQWKLGRKKIDDGAILVVAKTDRAVRIEVGYGLEGRSTSPPPASASSARSSCHGSRSRTSSGASAPESIGSSASSTGSPCRSRAMLRPWASAMSSTPVLIILALAVGGVLRAALGRVPGSLVTGGVVAVIAWFVVLSMALVAGLIALFVTLLGGGMGGRALGGLGGYYGGGGRGGSGGGGFSGGGGGFGGGGASGKVVSTKIKRIVALADDTRPSRAGLPRSTLNAIERAIKAAETAHAGEIRFVVEGALDGDAAVQDQSPRERAIDLFARLRVGHRAQQRPVDLPVARRSGGRGRGRSRDRPAKVGADEWGKVCRQMEAAFRQANYEGGVVSGIQAVAQHLAMHFPADGHTRSELPDKPVVI